MSPPPPGHARARLDWLDYARAVGIALIVFGHANRSIGRTFDLKWPADLQTLDAVLYAFHVPLFFVLSGIAIGLGRTGLTNFNRTLLWGLVYPYLIWSVIWIGLKANLPGGVVNAPIPASDALSILWQPVEHFWFLYHLIFIRLIWYFGELTLGTRHRILSMALLAFTAIGLRLMDSKYSGLAHFLENFVFFGIGLVFVLTDRKTVNVNWRPAVFAACAFVAVLWFGNDTASDALRLVTGLAGTLVIISICQSMAHHIQPGMLKALALIGQASLAIYLIHGIVIGAVRTGLRVLGQLTDLHLLAAGTIAGIVLPLGLYFVLQTLSAKLDMPLLQWAGLGTWRQRAERHSLAKPVG
jgi:fucose 4-O-acetylase-like acetyltransferase